MRLLKLKTTALFLMGLIMFSCSSDDKDETIEPSGIELDGKTLNWNSYAELWYYADGSNLFDMNVFSGSLRLSTSNYGQLTGQGDRLNIELYASSSELDNMTYNILDTGEEGTCTLTLNEGVSIENGYPRTTKSTWFVSGTVKISGSKNEYTVTINAQGEDGEQLKGSFKSKFSPMTVY